MAMTISSGLGSPNAPCLPHSHVQIPPFTPRCLYSPSSVRLKSLEAAKSNCVNIQGFGSLTFPSVEKKKQWTVKAAEEEASEADPPAPEPPQLKKKAKVVVKPPRKQRLVLKFMWLEKNIGLALDQVIPGHGTVPLSPYYFWPRKDAWEELKAKLESKSWISQKRTIILLNQATDIINLWQQSGSNL